MARGVSELSSGALATDRWHALHGIGLWGKQATGCVPQSQITREGCVLGSIWCDARLYIDCETAYDFAFGLEDLLQSVPGTDLGSELA